jgi:demethylmenaquinone methyltransferase/2-methoxy-6-polyprenyl-1,4-benzoquinol methylase
MTKRAGEETPATAPTAPHRVLTKYYRTESERPPFVSALFDATARHYDWVCDVGSLGSGRFYRRWVLVRSGLARGMTLLDVATGTGQVARGALRVLRDRGAVIGVDPSAGMLQEARRTLPVPLVQGTAESLPFAGNRFDFVTMGYALRHVADLDVVFRECRRVLKPGGRLLILEISQARSAGGRRIIRTYFERIMPWVTRLGTGSAQAELLMKYYWDTIVECVPPGTILDVLRATGFVEVNRRVRAGFLSEYLARKPV